MDKEKLYLMSAAHMDELAVYAHDNARAHGFYEDIDCTIGYTKQAGQQAIAQCAARDFTLAQIAKIASECGEAVDAIQRGASKEEIGNELADVIIRTMDLAEWMGIKIGARVAGKMRRNEERPYRHGKLC